MRPGSEPGSASSTQLLPVSKLFIGDHFKLTKRATLSPARVSDAWDPDPRLTHRDLTPPAVSFALEVLFPVTSRPLNQWTTSAPENLAGREVHPPASSPTQGGMRSGAAPPSQRACLRTPPAPSTPSVQHSPNLVGDSLGLGRGRLRGGRRSAHHLGGRRGGSVWTPGGGHAGAADTPGAADTRGSGREESSARTWRGGHVPCGRNHSARRAGGNRDRKWGAGRPGRKWSAGRPVSAD